MFKVLYVHYFIFTIREEYSPLTKSGEKWFAHGHTASKGTALGFEHRCAWLQRGLNAWTTMPGGAGKRLS